MYQFKQGKYKVNYTKYLIIIFFIIISGKTSGYELAISIFNKNEIPVADAVVIIKKENKHNIVKISDSKGHTRALLEKGLYSITIQHINYIIKGKIFKINSDSTLIITLTDKKNKIREIVVTAKENKGLSTSSVIDRTAMDHIQPTSFSDLLALLPGGISEEPKMNAANLIKLREAGISNEDYSTSSLGTSFLIDGAPVSTDANLQQLDYQSTSEQDYYRKTVNKGVDMRSISTDDIKKVEIVRGIPSVEYGDLTSGLVKIERKYKVNPFKARIKADGFSKLFYIGKGIKYGNNIINFGMDYLDAKADPRNNLENYKRLTGSLRLSGKTHKNSHITEYKSTIDYTGSIDNDKEDPDINYNREDSYKSSYNKISLTNNIDIKFSKNKFIKKQQFTAKAAFSFDKIKRNKVVQISRPTVTPSNEGAGVHDGEFMPFSYITHHEVDGKPLNIFLKAKTNFALTTGKSHHKLFTGAEWKFDKNYGKGQLFNFTRPIMLPCTTRPRKFSDIPARNNISVYAEDLSTIPVKNNTLKIMAGIRGTALAGLNNKYTMHNKVYFDPRTNIQWKFPVITIKEKELVFSLSGGLGRQTKLPTLSMLYPPDIYADIVQLSYTDNNNPDYDYINIRSYMINPVNYGLKPAVNIKKELRLGIDYGGNSFNITYFLENMTSGFRRSTVCFPLYYRDYDENYINASTLTSKPDIKELEKAGAYEDKNILYTYNKFENGSRIKKQGIEFQFASKRIRTIHTRFTINGAWYKTTYVNSRPMFKTVSTVINNEAIKDSYVGYYNWRDGYTKDLTSTNIIADTYLKNLGLTISATAQIMWDKGSKRLYRNGTPVSYIDNKGEMHKYTSISETDESLQFLIINELSEAVLKRVDTPIAGYLNIKMNKSLTKYANLSFFIDKILDYLPDYKAENGVIVRRSAKPYFGMEIKLKF